MSPEVRSQPLLRAYYLGFVAVLIATFTPMKALGYTLPGLFVVWMAFHGAVSRNAIVVTVGCSIAAGTAYFVLLDEFLASNYVVALVTFSAFLPLVMIPSRMIASRALLRDVLIACSTMLLVQGVVGILQALYGVTQTGSFGGANGDYVAGTIYPHLGAERAFSNPMFAVNMAFMLLACLSMPETSRDRRLHLALGTVALVLASVLHVLVFLVGAVVVAVLFTLSKGKGSARRALLLVVGISALSAVALSDNVELITRIASRAFDLEAIDIPRAVLMNRVVTELPDDAPIQPYLGLGPGQFSSRAALIMSGMYLGGPDSPKPLPLFSAQATRLSDDYCLSLMIAESDLEADIGSSQQPFFSYMTVYTETGLLGSVLVLWLFARALFAARGRGREAAERTPTVLLVAQVVFLFFLGWQASYWETPQAILVGVLLMQLQYAASGPSGVDVAEDSAVPAKAPDVVEQGGA